MRLEQFEKQLNIKWIDVNDELPLAKYMTDMEWGIIDSVFVLIASDTDPNDEAHIVIIDYLLDHDKVGKWCWCGGGDYPECHVKNIRYWARIPEYEPVTVLNACGIIDYKRET